MVVFLITFTVSSLISNSYAAQMTVVLSPSLNQAEPVFTANRFITLQYDPSSELAKKFATVNDNIRFKANASSPGMAELISGINQDIFTEKQSPISIQNATVDYTGTLRGSSDRLILSYKVVFTPSISGFTLPSNNSESGGALVDLDWRGFFYQ
jgi:hypothetical protein